MSSRTLRFRPIVALMGVALIGAACSSGPGASSGAPSTAAPSASSGAPTDAAASFDPLAPYPSKPGDLPTVRFSQGSTGLSYAPFIIAREMNFFEYQGVKIEFIELQSGATSIQAVSSGSVDLTDAATTEIAGAVGQGLDMLAIQNTIMMTAQLCVSESYAAEAGITADSSLEERIVGLKGATLGITGPGAFSDRALRFLLVKYGGLEPNTETTITQVGGSAAMSGALDSGQIDGFLLSPPACGQTESGEVLVEPADVPEFSNYVHEVVYGTREWIESNPELATAAATAVAMGNNFLLEHPEEALRILQEPYVGIDPAIIERAFNATIKPQVKADGRMDASMWQNTNEVLLEAGVIEQALDMTEGVIWSNEYLGDASVR